MSRPRDPKWTWLPDKVYFKHGRYVIATSFKPYKETFLAPGNATKGQVWNAFSKFDRRNDDNLFYLRDEYMKSEKFKSLMPATQESYERLLDQMMNWEMPRFKQPFGTLHFDEVGKTTIQSAYDQQKPDTARNRRFSVLKAVYSWGEFRIPAIKSNPVMGLEMVPEPPRDRYVTDKEYDFVYGIASPTLKLIMEASYLLRIRRGESFELKRLESILPHGVLVARTKGSWDGVVTWSSRMRKFVRDCKRHNSDHLSPWLIHNQKGGKITKSSFNSMWRRVWKKANQLLKSGQVDSIPERFPFHDLKAKGVTDHPDKEGGHKSAKMKAVYDRENRLEKPTK